jgi:MFS transporter, FSR family, fosmidomycin resistance protein
MAITNCSNDRLDTPPTASAGQRGVLAVACCAHALHDGFTDLLYVLFPIWQAAFGLDYAAVGVLRALAAGTMASMQVPSAWIAKRVGGTLVLVVGTGIVGFAYLMAGASGGLHSLALALVVGGVGLSTQHPIASSLVARAYDGSRSRAALGTYNFAGDIGKVIVPAITASLVAWIAWRPAISIVGAVGLAAALLIALALKTLGRNVGRTAPSRDPSHAAAEPMPMREASRSGFRLLLAIGVVDSATRMGFLTFLPFVLKMKGAELPTVGLALALVFAGGAAGKLVCGILGARLGVLGTVCLTEGLTAAGILALLPLSLGASLALLPLIGVALNGTSSVLYGTVPELVAAERRETAFGIFYTGTIGSGAVSPIVYGWLGDIAGVVPMMAIIALICLATIPLAVILRPVLAPRPLRQTQRA